jgi:hypothetical protein
MCQIIASSVSWIDVRNDGCFAAVCMIWLVACRGMQTTGVSPTSTGISASRPAGLGGDAGGILAGTDFLVDLGAAFLRVLGALAAEAGMSASKMALD